MSSQVILGLNLAMLLATVPDWKSGGRLANVIAGLRSIRIQ